MTGLCTLFGVGRSVVLSGDRVKWLRGEPMRLIGSEPDLRGDANTGLPFIPRSWEEKVVFRGCPDSRRGPKLRVGGGDVDLCVGDVGEDRSPGTFEYIFREGSLEGECEYECECEAAGLSWCSWS